MRLPPGEVADRRRCLKRPSPLGRRRHRVRWRRHRGRRGGHGDGDDHGGLGAGPVLAEHPAVEVGELRAGVDPQLVGEALPQALVDVEGIGLPAPR